MRKVDVLIGIETRGDLVEHDDPVGRSIIARSHKDRVPLRNGDVNHVNG